MPDPTDAPADARADVPAEAPVDAPAEAPVDAPAESRAETPLDPVDGRTRASASTSSGPVDDDAAAPQRLRAALVRPSRSQVVVGVLLAALGFAAITQVRTNTTDNTFAGYREQDLVNVLSGLAGTSQRAQAELNRLESARRKLEASERQQSAALGAAQKQADELAILAGTVPITGPGIRLTVTEGPRHVDVDSVLDTIEELRSAGAEGMQLNGKVRLVAQSSVQASDGGLLVDGTRLTSPYVLDAIGDPHTLQGALSLFGGPIDQFQESGATVDVQPEKSLDITAVRKAPGSELSQAP